MAYNWMGVLLLLAVISSCSSQSGCPSGQKRCKSGICSSACWIYDCTQEHVCWDGSGCYKDSHKCDGIKQCDDGTDELFCDSVYTPRPRRTRPWNRRYTTIRPTVMWSHDDDDHYSDDWSDRDGLSGIALGIIIMVIFIVVIIIVGAVVCCLKCSTKRASSTSTVVMHPQQSPPPVISGASPHQHSGYVNPAASVWPNAPQPPYNPNHSYMSQGFPPPGHASPISSMTPPPYSPQKDSDSEKPPPYEEVVSSP